MHIKENAEDTRITFTAVEYATLACIMAAVMQSTDAREIAHKIASKNSLRINIEGMCEESILKYMLGGSKFMQGKRDYEIATL